MTSIRKKNCDFITFAAMFVSSSIRMQHPLKNQIMSSKILVVDDSETSLFLMQSILEENDQVDFLLESDGQKALDQLFSYKPDLIILDLLMPGLDGFGFLEKAKQDPNTKDIPVIIMTAVQEKTTEQRAMELGAVEYLKKPLDINMMEEKIHQYL